jgi:hypothetical protein
MRAYSDGTHRQFASWIGKQFLSRERVLLLDFLIWGGGVEKHIKTLATGVAQYWQKGFLRLRPQTICFASYYIFTDM